MERTARFQRNLAQIVEDIESVALACARNESVSDDKLRKVLSFLSKVCLVAEQAFQDVYVVLVEVSLLREADLTDETLATLRREAAYVLGRSRFRDAEEICSRLHYLAEQYDKQLAEFVEPLIDNHRWEGLFGLLNEHEGRLIMIIQYLIRDLEWRLDSLEPSELLQLKAYAKEQASLIQGELKLINDFKNQILGISGEQGLLEMIAEPGSRAAVVEHMSVSVRQTHVDMSKAYSVGSGILVAEGANVRDINLDQSAITYDLDLSKLISELEELRQQMKSAATKPEHDVLVGHVAVAQQAASNGDRKGTLEALKRAGSWALSFTDKVGVGLATQAMKVALGLT